MHKFITGLSVLLFTLSGFITFKALLIPVKNTHNQTSQEVSKSEDLSPEVKDILGQASREKAANQALVEELQGTIAKLEGELSNKNEASQVNVKTGGPKEKARILTVLGAGAFRSGQDVINKDMIHTIEEIIPDILASPDHHVIIEGHTDNIPISLSAGRRYRDNMELSYLRAKAVAEILVNNKISLERISIIGYGDTHPIASNDTDEDRVKNRRVEVKLVPGGKEF
ncbi:MAG: OmpA family protein [Nitrospirae bacterium]|nr:OmpA family protein [Nitrospirota bacterium]